MLLSLDSADWMAVAYPAISIKHNCAFVPGKLWDSGLSDALVGTSANLRVGDAIVIVTEGQAHDILAVPGVIHWKRQGTTAHKYGVALKERVPQFARSCRKPGVSRIRFGCRVTGQIQTECKCVCHSAVAVDYSRRGISLETQASFAVGETIQFAPLGAAVTFNVIVRWIQKVGRTNRVGVELDFFNKHDYPLAAVNVRATLQTIKTEPTGFTHRLDSTRTP